MRKKYLSCASLIFFLIIPVAVATSGFIGLLNHASLSTVINAGGGDKTTDIDQKIFWFHIIRTYPELLDQKTLLNMTRSKFKEDQRWFANNYIESDAYEPVFRREQVEGKSIDMFFEQLAPQYRQRLLEVAATVPRRLKIENTLAAKMTYDPSRGLLKIAYGGRQFSNIKPGFFPILLPSGLQRPSKKMAEIMHGHEVYRLNSSPHPRPGEYRWAPPFQVRDLPRYNVSYVALDRRLEIEGIPMTPKQANKFLFKRDHAGGHITSVVEFTVTGVYPGYKGWSGERGVFFGRVEAVYFLGPDKKILARAPLHIFPTVVAKTTQK